MNNVSRFPNGGKNYRAIGFDYVSGNRHLIGDFDTLDEARGYVSQQDALLKVLVYDRRGDFIQ